MVARSDIILIAEVREVEPTFDLQPWSGGLIGSKQHVRYEIRSVLKGEFPDGEVRVAFYLIKNSLTAGKDWPHLSPELFQKNSLHIVFIEIDPLSPPTKENTSPISSYVGATADCGAIIATFDAEATIRRLLLRTKEEAAGTINGTEGHKVTVSDKTVAPVP